METDTMGQEAVRVEGDREPGPDRPLWIAQLRDPLKADERLWRFLTISDFAEAYLALLEDKIE